MGKQQVAAEIQSILKEDYGFNRDELSYAMAIAAVESNFNPDAAAKTSGASGVYQFINSTYKARKSDIRKDNPETAAKMDRLGKNSVFSQTHAFAADVKRNKGILKSHGVEITPASLYAAHFLGPGDGSNGASAVMKAGNHESLSRYVSSTQINANRGIKHNGKSFANFSVGDFKDWVTHKMVSNGADVSLNLLSEWQSVLKSSADHVIKELRALGAEDAEAVKLATALEKDPKDAKLLAKAAGYVSDQAESVLKQHNIELTSRNLSVGELLGGHTAVKVIAADPNVPLDSVLKNKDLINAYKNLNNTGIKDKEAGDITVGQFLKSVEAKQLADKEEAAKKAREKLELEGNKSFLEQMMGKDMGIMGFLMLLFFVVIMDAMGVDMSKQFGQGKQQPAPEQTPEEKAQGAAKKVGVGLTGNGVSSGGADVAEKPKETTPDPAKGAVSGLKTKVEPAGEASDDAKLTLHSLISTKSQTTERV